MCPCATLHHTIIFIFQQRALLRRAMHDGLWCSEICLATRRQRSADFNFMQMNVAAALRLANLAMVDWPSEEQQLSFSALHPVQFYILMKISGWKTFDWM